MVELDGSKESEQEEFKRLVAELRALVVGHQMLEEGEERLHIDHKVDRICSRLTELGVDIELLAHVEWGYAG